jgi:hypothetical protein
MESFYFHSNEVFEKYDWDSIGWIPELFSDPFMVSRKHKSGYIYKVIINYRSAKILLFDAFKEYQKGFDLEYHGDNSIYRYHNTNFTNFFKGELDKGEYINSYACMNRKQVYFDEVYEILSPNEFELLIVDLENE